MSNVNVHCTHQHQTILLRLHSKDHPLRLKTMLFNNIFLTTTTLLYVSSKTKSALSSKASDLPWNKHRRYPSNPHTISPPPPPPNDEIEVSLEEKITYNTMYGTNKTTPLLQEQSNITNNDKLSSNNSTNNKQWKIEEGLPVELQNRATLHKLHKDGCDIYLLGTSHVSKKSCYDVSMLMNHIVPDCLFIELCPQRIPILISPTEEQHEPSAEDDSSFLSQIHTLQRQTGMSYCSAFSTILLTKVQSNYASKLNIQAGAEFQQAYQSKSKSCRVILGDRPVKISLLRSWESLSIFGKIKLFLCLLYSCIKQPSEKDIEDWMMKVLLDENNDVLSKSIKEFTKHFPTIQNIIMNERDLYMYAKIRQTIQCLRCKKLVAIVGAGHCQGIVSLFQNDNHYDKMDRNLNVLLRGIVETDKMKVEDDDYIMSLTTDVIELHDTSNGANNPTSFSS